MKEETKKLIDECDKRYKLAKEGIRCVLVEFNKYCSEKEIEHSKNGASGNEFKINEINFIIEPKDVMSEIHAGMDQTEANSAVEAYVYSKFGEF
ncbi:MAG: hypothetical protein K9L62_16520 [Vallitaleaceae bacterium]|nr:hypothetical protein [Vallitaleaceae bacterium]